MFVRLARIVAAVMLVSAVPAGAAEPNRNLQLSGNAERRVALVIGNGRYPGVPLRNPVNDARDMAAALRGLGFDVIERTDVTQKEMYRAVTQFGSRLSVGGIALFFYAGHGIQVKGKNYLIPVDAQIGGESSVSSETVDVDVILDQLAASTLNLVILDACRNNPFERRFRSVGGGLAQMEAPKGTLIAYATAPGKVASDGTGRNGLYTRELLRVIQTPGLPVEKAFKLVRANVARVTNDNQIPWESSSLTGDFYFRPGAGEPGVGTEAPAPVAPDPAAIELAFWDGVKGSKDAGSFKAYLDQYPDGRFAALARVRIREFDAAQDASVAPRAGGRSARSDFLEGTWQAEIPGNEFQMLVRWNPGTMQYEGLLARHGQGSANVGFTVGETVWTAKPGPEADRLWERQMMRHSATDARWLDGELKLSASSEDRLVTSFTSFRRLGKRTAISTGSPATGGEGGIGKFSLWVEPDLDRNSLYPHPLCNYARPVSSRLTAALRSAIDARPDGPRITAKGGKAAEMIVRTLSFRLVRSPDADSDFVNTMIGEIRVELSREGRTISSRSFTARSTASYATGFTCSAWDEEIDRQVDKVAKELAVQVAADLGS